MMDKKMMNKKCGGAKGYIAKVLKPDKKFMAGKAKAH